jgi:kynurenine formamidase
MPIVDLSLPINNKMTGIPSLKLYDDNPTRCVVLSTYGDDHRAQLEAGGFEIAPDAPTGGHSTMCRLEIVSHVGTHIDAPVHFIEGGTTIDNVPLDSIVKKGRIIPLTDTPPYSPVTAEMVLATGVEFDDSVIPVLHTGWTDRTWGTETFWNDMIYLDTSVSELMVERGVSAVAMDFFPEVPFWRMGRPKGSMGPNHVTLLGNDTFIIQMLTNIGAIGGDDFMLVAAPLRLEGMDGSPARVFAIVE